MVVQCLYSTEWRLSPIWYRWTQTNVDPGVLDKLSENERKGLFYVKTGKKAIFEKRQVVTPKVYLHPSLPSPSGTLIFNNKVGKSFLLL